MSFVNNGAIQFFVGNDGNVGISTAAPSYRLHVSSGAGETGDILVVSTGTSNIFRVNGQGEVHAGRYYGDGSGLSGVTGANALLRTGDTMSGQLTIGGSSLTVTYGILAGSATFTSSVTAAYIQAPFGYFSNLGAVSVVCRSGGSGNGVTIQANDNSGAAAGGITLSGGIGSLAGGGGGAVSINAGDSGYTTGGAVNIKAGNGTVNSGAVGGNITLTSGRDSSATLLRRLFDSDRQRSRCYGPRGREYQWGQRQHRGRTRHACRRREYYSGFGNYGRVVGERWGCDDYRRIWRQWRCQCRREDNPCLRPRSNCRSHPLESRQRRRRAEFSRSQSGRQWKRSVRLRAGQVHVHGRRSAQYCPRPEHHGGGGESRRFQRSIYDRGFRPIRHSGILGNQGQSVPPASMPGSSPRAMGPR